MLDLSTFSTLERRGLVLMKAYEDTRRKHQFGFKVFKELTSEIRDFPAFKQFTTVVSWLESLGFSITWKEYHWQGFVEFAFKELHPRIPQPGQLKNVVILNHYLKSTPLAIAPEVSIEPIYFIYRKVIRPELLNDMKFLYYMGLEGVILALNKAHPML